MTQPNPTAAEVQVIYDYLNRIVTGNDYATYFPKYETFLALETLLAAVARDSLGWEKTSPEKTHGRNGILRIHINRNDAAADNEYFLKDAAP